MYLFHRSVKDNITVLAKKHMRSCDHQFVVIVRCDDFGVIEKLRGTHWTHNQNDRDHRSLFQAVDYTQPLENRALNLYPSKKVLPFVSVCIFRCANKNKRCLPNMYQTTRDISLTLTAYMLQGLKVLHENNKLSPPRRIHNTLSVRQRVSDSHTYSFCPVLSLRSASKHLKRAAGLLVRTLYMLTLS